MPRLLLLLSALLLTAPAALFAGGEGAHAIGASLPIWSVVPFVLLLLAIAGLPLVAHHWWESHRNKGIVALLLGAPMLVYFAGFVPGGTHELEKVLLEYGAFVALLGALYIIAGGIHIRGSLAGTPLSNTAILGIGALLASFIGTTGASMLLLRPLLRANRTRRDRAHIVVFFIFIVANIGGCLTPLGDPPLYIGFLRGVPFGWTSRLWAEWLTVNAILLAIFNLYDQHKLNVEEEELPGSQLEEAEHTKSPLGVDGAVNLFWLLGVVGVVFFSGSYGREADWSEGMQKGIQIGAMAALAGLSYMTTKKEVHAANRFTWSPIVEVAVLFAGIFVTMVPALLILEARGAELPVKEPWHFFWAAGMLSSFLDNAPTYLTFSALASGQLGTSATNLHELILAPGGEALLAAISCGAVFMGANTYIGNGPNFMVKAIAEENGVKMPSFFGYMAWSGAILIPVFVLVTFLFFR